MDAYLRIVAKERTGNGSMTTSVDTTVTVVDEDGKEHPLHGVVSASWSCTAADGADWSRCTIEVDGVEFEAEVPIDDALSLLVRKQPSRWRRWIDRRRSEREAIAYDNRLYGYTGP